ncbi:MAG: ABC transporter permease [Roseiflexaceae bacterium]
MNMMRLSKTYGLYLVITIIAVFVAFAIVLPRQLTRPIFFESTAQVTINQSRYAELFDAEGKPDQDMESIVYQTRTLLQKRYKQFATLELQDSIEWNGNVATILLKGTSSVDAVRLSDEYANELVRNIQAAGGREILRNILGWETVQSLQGEVASDELTAIIRDMVRLNVFTFNRPIEPIAKYVNIADLGASDQSDLLRAVEVQRAQLQFEAIDELDVNEQDYLQQKIILLQRFENILVSANPTMRFDSTSNPEIYRSADASASQEVSQIALVWYIFASMGGGVVFGLLFMMFDRSVGIIERVREIWAYRILIMLLVRRTLQLRYRGQLVGFAWTQIAPILQLMVYWIVYGFILRYNALPYYPVFMAVALLPWHYTTESMTSGMNSIMSNFQLIRKAYFPREVLPIAAVMTSLVNYLLSLPVMFLFIFVVKYTYTGVWSWPIPGSALYFPIILLIHTIFVLGVTLFLAGMTIVTLDTIHLTGIFLHIWFFLTPIVYSLTVLDNSISRIFRWLNPMASFIEYYREIFYGQVSVLGVNPTPNIPATDSLLRSFVTSVIVFVIGYWVFRRLQYRIIERM